MSTGFVPSSVSTVCVPATLARRSQGISVLAGERAQGFGLHASSGIGALLFFYGKVLCGSAQASGDRKTSAVAALAVVLTPDEVVPHPRFSGRRASFVRPASVWNGHADQ